MSLPATYLQMLSTVSEDGTLTMNMVEQPMPTPNPDQIVVRIEAAPINPSDHGVMFGWADISAATSSGEGKNRVLTAPVPASGMGRMKARFGQALPIGNEGAGTVVAAGDDAYAQSLMGKVVSVTAGCMYGEYCCVPAMMAMPLLDGHTAKDGASSFVNPLTSLSMLETMRMEGHTALVHTAAAFHGQADGRYP